MIKHMCVRVCGGLEKLWCGMEEGGGEGGKRYRKTVKKGNKADKKEQRDEDAKRQ